MRRQPSTPTPLDGVDGMGCQSSCWSWSEDEILDEVGFAMVHAWDGEPESDGNWILVVDGLKKPML